MSLTFFKYHGTGNDFIIIDNRDNKINLNKEQIKFMCDRRFGIGADGLMLLGNHPDFDFSMRYFNSDGNESTMCGNGGRCLVAFAKYLGITDINTKFDSIDGMHEASILPNGIISLQMQDVTNINLVNKNYFINTGSPHYVMFKDEINEIDIIKRGREIRFSEEFAPEGTNVNFVEIKGDKIFVRTYERGVEDETLSCGTGVTASAISTCLFTKTDKNTYQVITKGGELEVKFSKISDHHFTNIWLTGPAQFVFKGEINI